MDGIERSKNVLRKLEQNRLATEGLRVQAEQLDADMVHESEIGYISADGTDPSARMKVLLDKKWVLEKREKALRSHVHHVDRVLAALDKDEREVLKAFYCSGLKPGAAVVRLESEQNISRSGAYRIQERALWNFADRMGYLDTPSRKRE